MHPFHFQVILCANSRPALNDVTYKELTIVVKRVCQICPVINQACLDNRLVVMESGQGSPCLDLRLDWNFIFSLFSWFETLKTSLLVSL